MRCRRSEVEGYSHDNRSIDDSLNEYSDKRLMRSLLIKYDDRRKERRTELVIYLLFKAGGRVVIYGRGRRQVTNTSCEVNQNLGEGLGFIKTLRVVRKEEHERGGVSDLYISLSR